MYAVKIKEVKQGEFSTMHDALAFASHLTPYQTITLVAGKTVWELDWIEDYESDASGDMLMPVWVEIESPQLQLF